MPMPALVSSMPMPSYALNDIDKLSRFLCKFCGVLEPTEWDHEGLADVQNQILRYQMPDIDLIWERNVSAIGKPAEF